MRFANCYAPFAVQRGFRNKKMNQTELEEYLNIKLKLGDVFLLQMPHYILDISYSYDVKLKVIEIQIVLIQGYILEDIKDKVSKHINNYYIHIDFVFLTRHEFNSDAVNWPPLKYTWLTHILYSKNKCDEF